MCNNINPYGSEEEAVEEALAKLFKTWTDYVLAFTISEEEIRNRKWIESFFVSIRRTLAKLKDRSDYKDIFRLESHLEKNPKVFVIKCDMPAQ